MDASMEIEEYTSPDDWSSEVELSQLCRICASANEYLIPIFHGEGLEHELENKISQHLPIKVSEEDKLPIHLCYQCASTLIAWNDLVVTCIESEEKFKTVANSPSSTNYVQFTKDDIRQEEEVETQLVNSKQLADVDPEGTIIFQNEPNCENNPDETPNIVIEEVTSMDSQTLEDEVSSNSREMFYFENEEVKAKMNSPVIKGEDDFQPVQLYEDVETSVVVHNFVEGLEDGEYIAYITEDFADTSMGVIGNELGEVVSVVEECKPYICETCNRIFNDINVFRNHLTTHTGKGHFCDYCDVYYKRIDHLEKHMEVMHPDYAKDVLPREKKVNPYAKTFLCNTCGKILKSTLAYENHTLKHQSKCPFVCELCSEAFPNRGARRRHEVRVHNLLTKENGNTDGYHVCEVCGLELFSDGAYYHHKDKHGDPYPCGFCGKLYGSRSLMQVHARRHTTERPFVCTVCNRNFKVKQELNAHMNIHKDVRPYQCPHCPKMCRKSSDLTHHIRTHTGEKPYICDKCGRGFAQAGDMRKHRQLHFRPSKINKGLSL